jgi:carbon dioxide concentrating mechanism protein CcmN
MYLSPLQLSSNFQVCISGDVVVDEGAAIAPGVILRADPDSRISIAAGACIGMGVIIHANAQGTLEVGAGVILGAGVLIVGAGAIGPNACIGAATTLINPCIDKMQILPAGSLIGDGGRQVTLEAKAEPKAEAKAEPKVEPETTVATTPPVEKPVEEIPEADRTKPQTPPETTSSPESTTAEQSPQPGEVPTILYGQAHINRLLGTLFPYRQSFNKSNENGQTFSDGSE